MKAKEYFELYESTIIDDIKNGREPDETINKIFLELCDEVKELASKRNVKSDRGTAAIVKEINDKYNAIGRMFEKKYSASPLKFDGFKNAMVIVIPELKGLV